MDYACVEPDADPISDAMLRAGPDADPISDAMLRAGPLVAWRPMERIARSANSTRRPNRAIRRRDGRAGAARPERYWMIDGEPVLYTRHPLMALVKPRVLSEAPVAHAPQGDEPPPPGDRTSPAPPGETTADGTVRRREDARIDPVKWLGPSTWGDMCFRFTPEPHLAAEYRAWHASHVFGSQYRDFSPFPVWTCRQQFYLDDDDNYRVPVHLPGTDREAAVVDYRDEDCLPTASRETADADDAVSRSETGTGGTWRLAADCGMPAARRANGSTHRDRSAHTPPVLTTTAIAERPSSVALLARVRERLCCPVCDERYGDARVLPACGHTFCAGCIERWCLCGDERALACPLCRATSPMPDTVLDLPRNYALQAVVALLHPEHPPCPF